jgi:hypothetical protein
VPQSWSLSSRFVGNVCVSHDLNLNPTERRTEGSNGRRSRPSFRSPCFSLSCSFRYSRNYWFGIDVHLMSLHTVEHLICIGDPKQLRANLSTFGESQHASGSFFKLKFSRKPCQWIALLAGNCINLIVRSWSGSPTPE